MSTRAVSTGPVNLRDVGGLPTGDGGVTRHGVLLRSDAFYAGDDLVPTLQPWPPAAVVDLRTETEVNRSRYDWSPQVLVHRFPLHEAALPENLGGSADFVAIYRAILDVAADRVASLVGWVAEQESGPVLVHCAAGKDRTGIVVAALLLAADVDPEAVIEDYRRTEQQMAALQRRLESLVGRPIGGLRDGWDAAPRAAIHVVVEELTAGPGGARGWLTDRGVSGSSLDRWRDRLVEERS